MDNVHKLTTEELDYQATKLAREIDNLETYGRDFNGDWIDKRDNRRHATMTAKLEELDQELEIRSAWRELK